MMKFPEEGATLKDKILNNLYQNIQTHLSAYGLTAVRADKKNYDTHSSLLWNNLCIYMLGCKYGIAVLESKYKKEFNPNVALEYGFMKALGRDVALLEEKNFEHKRADLFGTLTKSFKWNKDGEKMDDSVGKAIRQWMIDLKIRQISS